MNRSRAAIFLGFALLGLTTVAQADPMVLTGNEFNGVSATAHIYYDPAAPDGNFGSPTNTNNLTAYNVSITSDANNVYFLLQADPGENAVGSLATGPRTGASYLDFANLYLSTDSTHQGATLGFEVGTDGVHDAFVPGGQGGYTVTTDESAVLFTPGTYNPATGTGTGDSFEIGISWSFFTQNPDAMDFPTVAPGGSLQFRGSQSFAYTYSGGSSYGDARLGEVFAPTAVPEPSSLAMMTIAGVAGLAYSRRRMRVAA